MANKRTYPTIQQMMDDLMASLATGKDYANTSMLTILGGRIILETTIGSILEAIESVTRRGCKCPVCTESLTCLNWLGNSVSLFRDSTATPTDNLIAAAWFLGNVSSIVVSTGLHLTQLSHFDSFAHVALATLAEQIPSSAKPEPEDPKDKPN
jgi:hypothetical protein